jgi:hypothetical protein
MLTWERVIKHDEELLFLLSPLLTHNIVFDFSRSNSWNVDREEREVAVIVQAG